MHIIGEEKIFLLIKSNITQVTTSVGMSMNQRIWVLHLGLHHLNPPSLDSKLTRKCKLGKNTKCSKGQRDADSNTSKLRQQWTIVFLLFNSSSSMYPRDSYIVLQWVNGRSNLSDLEAYGRPRDKWLGSTSRKTTKTFGLLHTSQCTRV